MSTEHLSGWSLPCHPSWTSCFLYESGVRHGHVLIRDGNHVDEVEVPVDWRAVAKALMRSGG